MPLSISDELTIQKNLLEQKDAWVCLAELELETGYQRITNHVEPVVWNTYTWTPFPFVVSDIKMSSKGEVPTAQVTVGNPNGVLTPHLRMYAGLSGKKGNLYLVNLAILDDAVTGMVPEKFMIIAASSQNEVVVFQLSLMVDAYGIEGPIESYDREKFPSLPIVQPRFSMGII
jgi:phage-related protein